MSIKTCLYCRNWDREGEEHLPDMHKCKMMSGEYIETSPKELNGIKIMKDNWPDIEKTGIESFPLCWHDGLGFEYFTKKWFGCVGFKKL